jgi:hypothetical protein
MKQKPDKHTMTNEKPPYDETKVFSACVLMGSALIAGIGLLVAIIIHALK